MRQPDVGNFFYLWREVLVLMDWDVRSNLLVARITKVGPLGVHGACMFQ